jgi:hypothetical protein
MCKLTGMPSSHAMSLFFIATFVSVAALDHGHDIIHAIDLFLLFKLPQSVTPLIIGIVTLSSIFLGFPSHNGFCWNSNCFGTIGNFR